MGDLGLTTSRREYELLTLILAQQKEAIKLHLVRQLHDYSEDGIEARELARWMAPSGPQRLNTGLDHCIVFRIKEHWN